MKSRGLRPVSKDPRRFLLKRGKEKPKDHERHRVNRELDYQRDLRQNTSLIWFSTVKSMFIGGVRNMETIESKAKIEMTETNTEIRLSDHTYLRPDKFVTSITKEGKGSNAWVGRILGINKNHDGTIQPKRDFLSSDLDESGDVKLKIFEIPGDGIYELRFFIGIVDGKPSPMDGYVLVSDGTIARMSLREMEAWANADLLRSSGGDTVSDLTSG